jgi:hypothetical protein
VPLQRIAALWSDFQAAKRVQMASPVGLTRKTISRGPMFDATATRITGTTDSGFATACQMLARMHAVDMKQLFLVIASTSLIVACPLLSGCKKAENASGSATQYTCAHHPEVVQSTPGKCPKCNMDLTVKK